VEQKFLVEEFVMKVRVKFAKQGSIKFVGHLDLMRQFQRAIRKAKIPIAYSQGFNPHQILSFAMPLPIGATAQAEYLDMQLTEDMEPSIIIDRLNGALPDQIRIEEITILRKDIPTGMAAVDAAKYKMILSDRQIPDDFDQQIKLFLAQKEIWVTKQSKKKTRSVDIREGIYELDAKKEEDVWVLSMFLAAGSRYNLKSELVVKAIYEWKEWELNPLAVKMHRIDLFSKRDDIFVSIGSM
jgi:radical SAM-linked protein